MNRKKQELKEYEDRAKRVLPVVLAEYANLSLGDTKKQEPDWINRDLLMGVEVTQAAEQKIKENESFYNKHLRCANIRDLTSRQIKKFRKSGLKLAFLKEDVENLEAGRIIGYSRIYQVEDGLRAIEQAIRKKYEKNYCNLKGLDLYIAAIDMFVNIYNENAKIEALKKFQSFEQECHKHFDHIFVDFYKHMLVFEMNQLSVTEIDYSEFGLDVGETA